MSTQIGVHVHDKTRVHADMDMLFVEENKKQNVMLVEFTWRGDRLSFFLNTREQARFLAAQLSTLADDIRVNAKKLEKNTDLE